MSVGPSTFAASLASLSQARGSETERTQHDSAAKERQITSDRQAESAAGVGTTEGDEAAGDRDADGRRLWERPPAPKPTEPNEEEASGTKDASGQCGSLLDLSG